MANVLIEDPALKEGTLVYEDRADAGRRLAGLLAECITGGEWVFAIPAGGVPVAAEIARTQELSLDLLVARKIQIPGNPEAGFGALAPGGARVLNKALLGRLRLTEEEMREQEGRTRSVMKEREVLFRKERPYPELAGKAVILVDDGLASGYTMRAAIAFIRTKNPAALTVAVPTALERTAKEILAEVDVLACPNLRSSLPFAVAEAYRRWHDLTDREVMEILEGFTKEG
jgi:predicted phosphoribosyltransferase